ncbi:MAG: radical SAM protein [Candidatus Omnitrophota bacterium]|nr:radical SAM protein [Candidatus Omnitrophota bacterium]
MDRILFIVPPNINYDDFVNPPYNVKAVSKKSGTFGAVITDMPLGIISLSAYLKKYTETQAKLIDFNCVLNKIKSFEFSSFAGFFQGFLSSPTWVDYAPSIVGISALFTPLYQSMLDIAQCCRGIFPNAMIVAGGGVPTNMYNEIFRDSICFDTLCYGEGEKPLLGLVKADDKLQYLEENPSWITRRKTENKESFRHDYIEDLDEIPFYDFDILEIDDYRTNPTIAAYLSVTGKKQNLVAMTSRGCVFNCCFCSSHTVHGKKMRYYSLPRIKEDFKRLRDQYSTKTIIFQDDHLMADKQRVYEIIDILKELQLTAFFPNSLALYVLDRGMLEAFKRVGVNQLVLSVESGSKRVLKEIMHKPLNLSIIKGVINDCREVGIYSDVNILIGLPGETKQDIEDSRIFLKTIYANWFRINVATPLVGSEMYDICLKKNYFKGRITDTNYKKAVVETEDFTAEYIQEMAYILNLELNFVYNSDFRLGNYEMALKGFENAIRAKSDHAIAYYYAAECYEKLGNLEKARQYMDTAKAIITEKPFWRKYAEMFSLSFSLGD